MFDFMIRILPNGRILVRDNHSKDSEVLKATEVSSYLEKALEAQIEAQNEEDDKVSDNRKKLQEEYQSWYDDQHANIGKSESDD